ERHGASLALLRGLGLGLLRFDGLGRGLLRAGLALGRLPLLPLHRLLDLRRLNLNWRRRIRGHRPRGLRQLWRLALRPLRRHDDRGGGPWGPALGAEVLARLAPAGALERDLLELLLQLLLRDAPALEPGASLHDLLDVELEDVAPAELALGALA